MGRVLCSLLISLISSSCGTSPPGEHPASLLAGSLSLNATWAQRKGAEKEPFGE